MIKLSGRLQLLAYLIGALLIAHAKILDELNPLLALIIGLTLMCSAIVVVYCLMLPLGFRLAYLAQKNKSALEKISEVPIPTFSTLRPWEWVLVIIDEILLSLKIFLVYQPWFENKQLRIDRCNNSTTNKPVLLIHGFMCNAGAWKEVHQFIENLDVTSYAMNLEPPLASIDDYAEQIHFAVTKIKQITSTQQVKVLAHSMGGIALRAYVRKFGEHDISSAITLGSPHHGTALAAFGMGKNVRQMSLGSLWLKELKQSEADIAFRKKIITIWTSQDNIVSPQHSATLPGAKAIEIKGCGHLTLLSHHEVRKILSKWLYCNKEDF